MDSFNVNYSTAAPSGWAYAGGKWGYSTTLGTSGGTVRWSFADLDLTSQLSSLFSGYPTISTPLSSWERDDIRKAVNVWESVCDIDFVEVYDSATANLRFGKSYLDGSGKILAEAYTWMSGSGNASLKEALVAFDTGDQASVTDALSTPQGFLSTAIHEIGHTIGLDHSSNSSAIMYPYYSGATVLASDDINGAQAVYGAASTTIPTTSAPTTALSPLQYTPDASIIRLYLAAFNRAPDSGGKQYWVSELAKGVSLQAIANGFCHSPEFASRYGYSVSDAGFLDHLYHNVLGRTGDTGGTAYWLNELVHGRSRGEVLVGFSESPENVDQNAAYIDATASVPTTVHLIGIAPAISDAPAGV